MTWYADTGLVGAAFGLVSGWFVPALVRRLPEPEPEDSAETGAAQPSTPGHGSPQTAASAEASPADVPEPKEPYAAIAARPGLRWKTAVATAVVAGAMAASVGWHWELTLLLYLAPVGVALALVDWRTRLLPTRLIAPSYAVVVVLVLLGGLVTGRWDDVLRSGLGWAGAGGVFLLLWLVYPKGMGYGDVRLSGVLGLTLGFLGWGPLVLGVWLGFAFGGIGGGLMAAARMFSRKAYPFGPFMLAGALTGVLLGGAFADWYVR